MRNRRSAAPKSSEARRIDCHIDRDRPQAEIADGLVKRRVEVFANQAGRPLRRPAADARGLEHDDLDPRGRKRDGARATGQSATDDDNVRF